jgi:acetylglutamate/LysW-gamma-L-alpha-aminoadipate kinase
MSRPPLVIKIGGSVGLPTGLLDELAACREPLIVVHGAHRIMDALATQLGHSPRMVTSANGSVSRYTDEVTMNHFLMAYCGQANKRLVQSLLAREMNAVGLAALDGGMVRGRRRADIRIRENGRTLVLHDDHAGTIESVDPTLLQMLLETGYVPVVCPPALGHDGSPINVDGDRLAAELAIALGAEQLIIFSDTPGWLSDPADRNTTIARAALADLEVLQRSASGRARAKIVAAERALRGGVTAVGICDGHRRRPLSDACGGAGTWITVGTPGMSRR